MKIYNTEYRGQTINVLQVAPNAWIVTAPLLYDTSASGIATFLTRTGAIEAARQDIRDNT